MEVGLFSSKQMEFLAEDLPLKIIPKFRQAELHFISGDYGPFIPNHPVEVPLWLAISLKKGQKCQIVAPDWMDVDYLSEKLKREQDEQPFENLPFHYMELVSLLLSCADDDIPNAEVVRSLVEDIENVRSAKIRRGMQVVADDVTKGGDPQAVKMNGVSAMEINSIRPFLVEALGVFNAFNPNQGGGGGAGEGAGSQPDSQGQPARRRFGEGGEEAGGGRKLRRFR